MHKIYFIFLTSCVLQSSLCAMDLKNPQQLSPKSRRAALIAKLEAQREYEYQLEEQLYNGEISQSEHDAYYDNRFLAMVVQIVPTKPHIDAANNCGQTRLHLAVIFAEETDPASLDVCRSLIRQGARIDLENRQEQTPLYLAAVHKESVPLTKVLLWTCPTIKPVLKTIWLVFRRFNLRVPSDVLKKCIAPFIFYNAAQEHLAMLNPILTVLHQDTIIDDANPWIRRTKVVNSPLWQRAKKPEIKALLNPSNVEQLRAPIIKELHASIGITIVDIKNDENNN